MWGSPRHLIHLDPGRDNTMVSMLVPKIHVLGPIPKVCMALRRGALKGD
jgi:hypothetical protein